MQFPQHRVYGGSTGAGQEGPVSAIHNVFIDWNGHTWSYHGVSMFLLFFRWLQGQNIDADVSWCASIGANTVRVLGMVNWGSGKSFGPKQTPGWWDQLLPFVDYLASRGMRIEFVVFASAQDMMPDQHEQREHLHRVVEALSGRWNVFIEVCNEPWQNGCDPVAIFDEGEPRGCSMAYGLYNPVKRQRPGDGLWIATLPVLDYLTVHTERTADSWSRKAKDLCEYRDGSGDGSENGPLMDPLHVAPVGDEPMGAAEQIIPGKRSNIPEDFFWYAANAEINGAGSTFHFDLGLDGVRPPAGSYQDQCGMAMGLAWANIEPEFQTGRYTRGGLADLPMVWEDRYFPEQTSRLYGRILGDRACCVAIKPLWGWVPKAAPGWHIVSTVGPMNSLVHLER